jgi:hypothetical protein
MGGRVFPLAMSCSTSRNKRPSATLLRAVLRRRPNFGSGMNDPDPTDLHEFLTGIVPVPPATGLTGALLNLRRQAVEPATKAFRDRGIHPAQGLVRLGFPPLTDCGRPEVGCCGRLPRSAGPTGRFAQHRTIAPTRQTRAARAWRWPLRFRRLNSCPKNNPAHAGVASGFKGAAPGVRSVRIDAGRGKEESLTTKLHL